MSSSLKILVLRTDNLGDLILTLPALRHLRQTLPQAEISVVIKAPFHKLFQTYLGSLDIKMFRVEEPWDRQEWSACLALYCNFKEAFRVLRSGAKLRVGTYSQIWSFFLLNKGLRQKRSLAEKSEALYTLELAELLTQVFKVSAKADSSPVLLPAEPDALNVAEEKLESLGVKKGESFFVLHPGMAGSALNLEASHYLEVIEKLSAKSTVLISVGPGSQDQVLWSELSEKRKDLKKLEGLDLSSLKEVFRKSRTVIAPSTGPLHLAAAVGVPTVGLYSPIKSHHPIRWAPWGGAVRMKILFPQVVCPANRQCWGKKCRNYNCMDQLQWGSLILEAINGLT